MNWKDEVKVSLDTMPMTLDRVLNQRIGEPLKPGWQQRLTNEVRRLGNVEQAPVFVFSRFDEPGSVEVVVGEMTGVAFRLATGRQPERDELHRVNCDRAGDFGHQVCGWCVDCGQPRFVCGHLV